MKGFCMTENEAKERAEEIRQEIDELRENIVRLEDELFELENSEPDYDLLAKERDL